MKTDHREYIRYGLDVLLSTLVNLICIWAVLIVTMLGTDYIIDFDFAKVYAIIGNVVFLVTFLILAPIEHYNKPLSAEKKHRNKILGWISYGIVLVAQVVTYIFVKKVSVYISTVLFVIGIFMVLGRWKGYLYEKKKLVR